MVRHALYRQPQSPLVRQLLPPVPLQPPARMQVLVQVLRSLARRALQAQQLTELVQLQALED